MSSLSCHRTAGLQARSLLGARHSVAHLLMLFWTARLMIMSARDARGPEEYERHGVARSRQRRPTIYRRWLMSFARWRCQSRSLIVWRLSCACLPVTRAISILARPRKLLLHRAQINKLIGAIQREGRTVVPLQVYFNPRGRAKIEIALVTGKQAHDKRQSIKDRDWQRQRARLLSHRR